MRLQRVIRVLQTLTWRRPAKCQVVQFGGLEVTALSLLSDEFTIDVMPLVSERVSLPVVLRTWIGIGFSRWAYYRAFLNMTGARVVLVWHDTTVPAYMLRQHIAIPVFCIQNGVRHNLGPASGTGFLDELQSASAHSTPTADAYFCFGTAEPAYLDGIIETRFVPHGSFRANAFAAGRQAHPRHQAISGIGFIVSFPSRQSIPGDSVSGNHHTFMWLGSRTITYHEYFSFDAVVARAIYAVCQRRGLRFSIIGKRSDETSAETQYFHEALNDRVEVLTHTKGEGYELAERFQYLVTIDSTLGYEMRALGKPVAFIANRLKFLNITDDDLSFGFPLDLPTDGPYWSSATSESAIVEFLHRWLEWETHQEIREFDFDLMRLDPGNSQLRGLIRRALAEPR